jgi:Tfp pilus assembly protein PilN
MSPLDLDFAADRARYPSAIGLLLLVAGLLAAGMTTRNYLAADTARTALESRLASEHQKAGVRSHKLPDAAELARKTADDGARQRLGRPWAQLMAALDHARGQEVGFLSIEADGRRGQMTLKAEARNYDAMLAFYQRLQASSGLEDVILTQHQMTDEGGVSRIGFTMKLRWGQS